MRIEHQRLVVLEDEPGEPFGLVCIQTPVNFFEIAPVALSKGSLGVSGGRGTPFHPGSKRLQDLVNFFDRNLMLFIE